MKQYLIEYKPFLLFLGKFLISYLILTFIYQSYLTSFDVKNHEVDGFTQVVSNQTEKLLLLFDCDVKTMKHPTEPSIKLNYNQKWVARVIEGCNGLSVIILFISFIIAFSGKIKTTLLYILFGIIVIHILNVARIALLVVLMYHFPEYNEFLHGVLFPLLIYGTVFLLWVIWVNKFSFYAKKSIEK